jgi:hypothetical protein
LRRNGLGLSNQPSLVSEQQRAIAEANINIRPRQGNRSRLIQDMPLREQVEDLVRRFLEGAGI